MRSAGPGGAHVAALRPEGTVRVVLDSGDPYTDPPNATFTLYETYPVIPRAHTVFDVPAGQYTRWGSAVTAWNDMQEEIKALIRAREGTK